MKARLAQSVERKALNLVVVGSSPTVGDSQVFFYIKWYILDVQMKYSELYYKKAMCAVRESNPGHLDGNEIFYH